METSQSPDNVEEQLRFILGQVNEWLKFAEAKNAALVAVAAAVIFGIFQSVNVVVDWAQPYKTLFLLMLLVLFSSAGLFALLSFLPRTEIPFILRKEDARPSHNLLFFGDIAKYDADTYLKELCRRMAEATTSRSLMQHQLSEQVVVNAQIAALKYMWFEVALWCALAAVVTPPIAYAVYVILRKPRKPA